MARNHLYTIKSTSDTTFSVTKFDLDFNPEGELYHVSVIGAGKQQSTICTCPAGHRTTCRHRQMLDVFKEEERIDSGWFYHFDKRVWIEPISLD